ncbi:MAG: hypothetical protein WCL18_10750 [bacterium]
MGRKTKSAERRTVQVRIDPDVYEYILKKNVSPQKYLEYLANQDKKEHTKESPMKLKLGILYTDIENIKKSMRNLKSDFDTETRKYNITYTILEDDLKLKEEEYEKLIKKING